MALVEITPYNYTLARNSPLHAQIQKAYRWYSPKFSPHDVPRFADVGSITENPLVMRSIRDFLVQRYKSFPQPPTHIMGFDARGFLFGPLIAVELGIPFVLMRKANKNAGVLIKSEPYEKEYKEVEPEVMTIRLGSIDKNSRVVLVDDVLATGGTALSGLQLAEASGATVLEVVSLLQLTFLKGVELSHSYRNGRYSKIPFFSFVDETALTDENCGDLLNYTGKRAISCSEALSKL
ncbi:putative Adenine phosphoribosyltransferase [Trypanosoma theileri]|uniref:adenine phosphoribosyltransferase n=1 Tax=Trypanosoma theileri TaxID=67003 RepID=A0A1X0NSL0_9TRYP|nr:putative Adenine phosphoribosyltransferase [Trypanosoma theileri]ORC87677.1 putative Adenine phosphoribosyltransferase [Trypanosoma theileri]